MLTEQRSRDAELLELQEALQAASEGRRRAEARVAELLQHSAPVPAVPRALGSPSHTALDSPGEVQALRAAANEAAALRLELQEQRELAQVAAAKVRGAWFALTD